MDHTWTPIENKEIVQKVMVASTKFNIKIVPTANITTYLSAVECANWNGILHNLSITEPFKTSGKGIKG